MSLFDTLVEPLRRSAQVNAIYGDPITAGRKTVIPVARIGYAFRANEDTETETGVEETETESRTGGGGGVAAIPIGVLEIGRFRSRFIPFRSRRRLVAAFIAGAAVGYWLHRRQIAG